MNNLKNSTKKKYIRLFKAYNDVIFEAGSNARFMSKESLYTMAGKKVEDDYSPQYSARLIKEMIRNGVPKLKDEDTASKNNQGE